MTSIKSGAQTTESGIVKDTPIYRDEDTFAAIFNAKGEVSEKSRWNDQGKSPPKLSAYMMQPAIRSQTNHFIKKTDRAEKPPISTMKKGWWWKGSTERPMAV